MPRLPSLVVSFALVAGAAPAATDSLLTKAPFGAPPAPEAAPVNQALGSLELTGMVVIDGRPRFSLKDLANQKTYWLELGVADEGLTVTSYDLHNNTATVQGRGGSRLLVLKSAAIAATSPVSPAAPAPAVLGAPARPATAPVVAQVRPAPKPEPAPANLTPEQQKTRQAETEARMLVSDLMEISMQERARFAEEQRKKAAAQQNAGGATK